jgi:hypothetical protein
MVIVMMVINVTVARGCGGDSSGRSLSQLACSRLGLEVSRWCECGLWHVGMWAVMPRSFVDRHYRFRGTYCVRLQCRNHDLSWRPKRTFKSALYIETRKSQSTRQSVDTEINLIQTTS